MNTCDDTMQVLPDAISWYFIYWCHLARFVVDWRIVEKKSNYVQRKKKTLHRANVFIGVEQTAKCKQRSGRALKSGDTVKWMKLEMGTSIQDLNFLYLCMRLYVKNVINWLAEWPVQYLRERTEEREDQSCQTFDWFTQITESTDR